MGLADQLTIGTAAAPVTVALNVIDVVNWVSGLVYAVVAPRLLRSRAAA